MVDSMAEARVMALRLGALLVAQGKTLAFAESCTGGLAASLITDIAGSSVYFLGSAVTYSYEAKEQVLGVAHETLLAHGAVSTETASEMARGARRLFGSDLAVSVTGIAGPGGATPEKPVGLVCIHLSADGAEIDVQHIWDSDRIGNKLLSAQAVLALAIGYLEGDPLTALRDGLDPALDDSEPQTEAANPVGNSPDFPDEPADVDVRLLRGGRVVPTAFTWRGRRYAILDVGREWQEEIGGTTWRSYLVRTPGPTTFELRFDPAREQWQVARVWGRSGEREA